MTEAALKHRSHGAAALSSIGKSKDVPDAGLKASDHYERTLPPWRYRLRQQLLPLIRRETPYLSAIQQSMRTPALDSYFAMTANLGTPTFFTLLLPVQFWCGAPALGKQLIHILSAGVFFTGMLKDFYSLPRPLSPPLHRITMSGSVALEYGFPSTHSTNAVSVAVLSILHLRDPDVVAVMGPSTAAFLEALAYFYTATIAFGRIYCGMHGFIDVVVGGIMGAAISLAVYYWGPVVDGLMYESSWVAPLVAVLVCVLLVWIHPEPADDCPCFDDGVVVAGVVMGAEIGTWTHGRIAGDPWTGSVHAGEPPRISSLSWPVFVARLLMGFVAIFAWREVMKPALLRGLPHVFRLGSRVGLTHPRRFFLQADEYTTVPAPRDSPMGNTLPDVHEIPRAVEGITNLLRRPRSVSTGPQSAADAYETLAYRDMAGGRAAEARHEQQHQHQHQHQRQDPAAARRQDAKDVFSHVVKPRARYDVEVVTTLVVYTGISLLATTILPILFEVIGLGTNQFRQDVI